MVNKNENICDMCTTRVANRKCILCLKDLCSSCSRHSFDIVVRSKDTISTLGDVYVCKACKSRLTKELGKELFDDDFKGEIANQIGKYLVRKIMVENL
jgi:CYTH domain-containing protein